MNELTYKSKICINNRISGSFLIHFFLFLIMTTFTLALFLHTLKSVQFQGDSIVLLATLISGLGIYFLLKIQGISFASVYLMYLSLAHLGTVTSELLFPGAFENFTENVPRWFYSDLLPDTVALVGISIYFFVVATLLCEKLIIQKSNKNQYDLESQGNKLYYYTGTVFILAYAGYLVFAILTGNMNISGTYAEYREARTSLYPWLVFLFRVGIAFSFANGTKKQLILTGGLISIPSFIVFMSGSRGEIIYPLAAGIVVLLMRGFKLQKKHILIGALVFFLIIPTIAQTRRTSFREHSIREIGINLTDPFVEAGVIIRPFMNTYGWIQGGEPYAYGRTYIIPIQNMLSRFPGISRFPLEGSRYFLTARTPTQGYSTLAEAYFNFGIAGLFIWTTLVAWLLTYFKKKLLNFEGLALSGAIYSILIHNIRGHFLSVPAYLTIILIIYLTVKFITLVSKTKSRKIS